jgi:hypothetical protein
MCLIIYGADIGVYKINPQGIPRSTTTFAWARFNPGELNNQKSVEAFRNCSTTGKRLTDLAQHIVDDLKSGTRIAVGFEAPMWIPAPTSFVGPRSLFGPRFSEEQGFEWYLQSGAAATAKALVLGKLLWSIVGRSGVDIIITTGDPQKNSIRAYEGFVAGKFKSHPLWECSQDEWDALCSAFAYAGAEGLPVLRSFEAVVLNDAPDLDVISHWETITRNAGLDATFCKRMCKVVALKRLLEAAI